MNAKEMLFFRDAVPAAQSSQATTGVPASVTLAQAALESGWFDHMPPGSNNPFGIKATHLDSPSSYVEALTTEFVHGQLEHLEQPFQKFETLADAFTAHAELLSQAKRYESAMAVKTNAAEFAEQLQACGYSTSPTYAKLLTQLMDEFDLERYDVAV